MHRSHQPFGGFDQKSWENLIPVLDESITVFPVAHHHFGLKICQLAVAKGTYTAGTFSNSSRFTIKKTQTTGNLSQKAAIKPAGTAMHHITTESQHRPNFESLPAQKISDIVTQFIAYPMRLKEHIKNMIRR